jgi:hypothetical protein
MENENKALEFDAVKFFKETFESGVIADYTFRVNCITFRNSDGKIIWELDSKNNIVWINYRWIWEVLETKIGVGQVDSFLKEQLEVNYGFKNVVVLFSFYY